MRKTNRSVGTEPVEMFLLATSIVSTMSAGRRSVYCSLGLILVLSHLTTAYSVEEICSRRCLYHRGGVLCNCNARHFTGKRGLAADADQHTVQSVRTNNHFHDSLVPGSDGTLSSHFVTSQVLQQQIRHLWARHRVGHLGRDIDQQVGHTVEGTDDQDKNNVADQHIDESSEVMLQQDVPDEDFDDVRTVGGDDHYTVVSGGDDAEHTRVASHLRQLQAAMGRALQGRRRSRFD